MYQFDLSLAELSLVGLAMGLDVQQYPYSFPRPGVTQDERIQAAREVNDTLYARGYARDGAFVPELSAALRLFATAQPSIVVMGNGARNPILARAARDQSTGVVAHQLDERMYFTFGDSRELVSNVLGLLPNYGRGSGHSATIPMAGRIQQDTDDDDVDFSTINFLDGPHSSSSGGGDGFQQRQKQDLRKLVDGDRLGSGSIRIERDGAGGRRFLLRWIDTTTGRYAGYTTYGPDGRELMTFAPADHEFLRRTIDGFLQQLGG